MKWVKFTLHFPSFFSSRIPDYSSQYALSLPIPSPSTVKLGLVATAIRTSGRVEEGERVFYAVRDSEVMIKPPEQIIINSFLIKRLKKKGEKEKKEKQEKIDYKPAFENTFGTREYVFYAEDPELYIGCEDLCTVKKYIKMLRYLGSSDSIVYVKQVKEIEKPPQNAIKAVKGDEFNMASKIDCVVYPVKDIDKKAKFEELNPFSGEFAKNVFEIKYYLIRAKIKKGKNWKVFNMYTP